MFSKRFDTYAQWLYSCCTIIVQVRMAGAVAVARKAASLKTALHVKMLSLTFC